MMMALPEKERVHPPAVKAANLTGSVATSRSRVLVG
jgi:hypothetical protein